ncbi:MAG TPA: BTAD domain-containing putative transcriptional regulator [Gemmatimonadales bacterium]|nr:BTAD domain-containing putative transcriptional regulator [Gemmatimonadales bacterium]
MYRLTTFGGLSIGTESGPLHGAPAQSRRLALLAVLAAAPRQGVTRDKIAALLWPESSEPEARHALRQLLSLVRRELGEDAVLSGSPELLLNPRKVSTDIQEFEAALAHGEFERATALYTGPFLDGFFLNGAAEFERWTEDKRTHFARQLAAALETAAEAAAQRGDHAKAVTWWRQLATVDRFSSRVTLRLMHALVAAGDSAAALQAAREHEVLLRDELDAEPDRAVVDLARRLQTTSAKLDTAPMSPAAGSPSRISEAEPQPPPALVPPRDAAVRRRAVLAAAVLAASIIALKWYQGVSQSAAHTIDRRAVVVVPFHVVGADASLRYLEEGMVDLLAAQLSGEDGLQTLDARAVLSAWRREATRRTVAPEDREIVSFGSRLGAGHVLQGSVLGDPRHLVLTGSLLSVPDGRVEAGAHVEGPGDSLTTLIDRFVGQLLIARTGFSSGRETLRSPRFASTSRGSPRRAAAATVRR